MEGLPALSAAKSCTDIQVRVSKKHVDNKQDAGCTLQQEYRKVPAQPPGWCCRSHQCHAQSQPHDPCPGLTEVWVTLLLQGSAQADHT